MGGYGTFVAEPKRDYADVYAGLQQMHCCGVANGMRGDFSDEAAFLEVFFEFAVDGSGGKACPPFVEEDSFFIFLCFCNRKFF